MTAHAYAVLDAYEYGFALQEATSPATGGEEMAQLAAEMFEHIPVDHSRHLAEFTTAHVVQPETTSHANSTTA